MADPNVPVWPIWSDRQPKLKHALILRLTTLDGWQYRVQPLETSYHRWLIRIQRAAIATDPTFLFNTRWSTILEITDLHETKVRAKYFDIMERFESYLVEGVL